MRSIIAAESSPRIMPCSNLCSLISSALPVISDPTEHVRIWSILWRPLRLLHRPYAQTGYFRATRQAENRNGRRSDVIWLHQPIGRVRPAGRGKDPFLTRCCGGADMERRYTHACGIDFVTQAVGNGLQRVLCCGKLADVGARGKSLGRIDKK